MEQKDKDKMLKKEVDDFLEVDSMIENLIEKKMGDNVQHFNRRKLNTPMKWAAIILFLVSISYIVLRQIRSSDPKNLFANYYEPFKQSMDVRSINTRAVRDTILLMLTSFFTFIS